MVSRADQPNGQRGNGETGIVSMDVLHRTDQISLQKSGPPSAFYQKIDAHDPSLAEVLVQYSKMFTSTVTMLTFAQSTVIAREVMAFGIVLHVHTRSLALPPCLGTLAV